MKPDNPGEVQLLLQFSFDSLEIVLMQFMLHCVAVVVHTLLGIDDDTSVASYVLLYGVLADVRTSLIGRCKRVVLVVWLRLVWLLLGLRRWQRMRRLCLGLHYCRERSMQHMLIVEGVIAIATFVGRTGVGADRAGTIWPCYGRILGGVGEY